MNIKIAQLASKPFAVRGTVKNLKKTYQLQLDMANSDEKMNGLDGVEALQAVLDIQEQIESFMIDVLNLSEKQIEKLEDLEQEELMEIAQYLAMRIMGMSDADIKATLAEAQEDSEGLE
ncbi:phage tail tube assembly chaperone [Weissella paramesenteroides]|jgi:hypothetical protein|uniref:phage tail tube assembly chaperone n=1 Tax=Weissella paramesenteroides TaxID=1249 RepID=UPI0039827284